MLQLCPTLCDPKDGIPPGSPIPECPEKKTGVGCHFLPQHMKVKSESEVVQSCPTLRDPMDCSPPGSIHGIFQERELEWGANCLLRQFLKEYLRTWSLFSELESSLSSILCSYITLRSPWESSFFNLKFQIASVSSSVKFEYQ